MKDLLRKVLKGFLVFLAVVLVVLLAFGITLWRGWPWWVGFFILLLVVGAGLGVVFARRFLSRRREQQFVQQVIAQDEARIKTLGERERDEMKALQDRWKEAVDALRRSHLKKFGNPLYVLPWYMVIGESGSGKTTAITSARLSSPFAEMSRTSGISGTRNCDWWFFEQAVIIDTAGRYAIPVDEGRDKDEWQGFLNLLVKYRKKEPLHGLIVTVAADKLLEASTEAMADDGKEIRRRIDELMRVLGVKFPVYVLVTKCDLVQGMTRFSEQLPEKGLEQPLGVVNQDLSTDVAAFMGRAFDCIGERLRNIRLLQLHQTQSSKVSPGLLIFPDEFGNLRRGLDAFMNAAFGANPYQETPILRGLYFSSGRQEGTPFSHFLGALGLIGEKEVLPGTNKGLFLHDFFASILPRDRGLFAPTRRAIEWSVLTRNLGLTAWLVTGVALCGLLTFAFYKNTKIMNEVPQEFRKPLTLRGETLTDLITMDRFSQGIITLEGRNINWWVPRFGLDESIDLEHALKDKFCAQFRDSFLSRFDKRLTEAIPTIGPATPDDVTGHYIAHLVRRINLLKMSLDGRGIENLRSMPQPPYLSFESETAGTEVRKKFGALYLQYLLWRKDAGDVNKEIGILQSWLRHVLTVKGKDHRWLVSWVNSQGDVPAVGVAEFWGGADIQGETVVAPAFTRKGRERVDAFMAEMETAVTDPIILADSKQSFARWYRDACLQSWRDFVAAFPRGAERLKGQKEWQPMAGRMAGDGGPYFALLNRVTVELEPLLSMEGDIPAWLRQIYQLQTARAAAAGGLGDIAEKGRQLIAAVEKKIGKTGAEGTGAQLAATKAFQDYSQALAALIPISSSRGQAFQAALQVFTEDPTASKSPFYLAQGALARLKAGIPDGRAMDDISWRLVSGPVDFLWRYTRMETSCQLQGQWEEKVLSETQGATGQAAAQILLSPEGPVWKFVKGGQAAPFIGWSVQRGYYTKEVMGGGVPLNGAFFSFLSRGVKAQTVAAAAAKQSYGVTIRGLPTDANPEAQIKPESTSLELQCATGAQSLVNHNYPVKKVFQWSPDSCLDVTFRVQVGNVLLTRKYTGPQAFPEFLQDFRGGHRTFHPQEFPAERAALERLGIRAISVNYQFSGEQSVLGRAAAAPGQAPTRIAQCWD